MSAREKKGDSGRWQILRAFKNYVALRRVLYSLHRLACSFLALILSFPKKEHTLSLSRFIQSSLIHCRTKNTHLHKKAISHSLFSFPPFFPFFSPFLLFFPTHTRVYHKLPPQTCTHYHAHFSPSFPPSHIDLVLFPYFLNLLREWGEKNARSVRERQKFYKLYINLNT